MKDCRGDLLGRIRSGLPSAQDRAAFEAHLNSCESCRISLEVMDDFDKGGDAEPGDWARVSRMAAHAAAVYGERSRAPRRLARGPWALAAVAIVVAGAAVAGGALQRANKPSASSTHAPQESLSAQPARGSEKKARVLLEPPADPPPEEIQVPLPEPPPKSTAPTGPTTTAADLYRAANDARRSGRTGEAIGAYQKLQKRFPGSAEGHASRVSLGGLLLRNGSFLAALTQFDAYLASGGGRLAAEALFGRAQALRALGRSVDEVQDLERLVKDYPTSAYATHAKRRLSQIR